MVGRVVLMLRPLSGSRSEQIQTVRGKVKPRKMSKVHRTGVPPVPLTAPNFSRVPTVAH